MNILPIYQPLMHNGKTNPNRWLSQCGKYAIAAYEYYRGMPCLLYYVGYCVKTNKRLTEGNKHTLLDVVEQLQMYEQS